MTASEVRVGRPRSVEADDAIYAATIDEILEFGFGGFTVESLAQRAGVGKATIYRRYATREALLVAVMERCAREAEATSAPVDTGALRSDLRNAIDRQVTLLTKTDMGRLFPRIVSEVATDDTFTVLKAQFKRDRRQPGIDAINRGKERGEVRPEVDPEDALDLLSAPVFAQFLLSRRTFPNKWRDDIVDFVVRALA